VFGDEQKKAKEKIQRGAIEINDIKWMFCGLRTVHSAGPKERSGKWGREEYDKRKHM
jgi:hypothetical protein